MAARASRTSLSWGDDGLAAIAAFIRGVAGLAAPSYYQGQYGHLAGKPTWLFVSGVPRDQHLRAASWGKTAQRIHPRALELHGYEKAGAASECWRWHRAESLRAERDAALAMVKTLQEALEKLEYAASYAAINDKTEHAAVRNALAVARAAIYATTPKDEQA